MLNEIATQINIEATVKEKFMNEEGVIEASFSQRKKFLLDQGYSDNEINIYLAEFNWDEYGNPIHPNSF